MDSSPDSLQDGQIQPRAQVIREPGLNVCDMNTAHHPCLIFFVLTLFRVATLDTQEQEQRVVYRNNGLVRFAFASS